MFNCFRLNYYSFITYNSLPLTIVYFAMKISVYLYPLKMENSVEFVFHEEVELEQFEFDEESKTYTYPCPCGDRLIYMISSSSF